MELFVMNLIFFSFYTMCPKRNVVEYSEMSFCVENTLLERSFNVT